MPTYRIQFSEVCVYDVTFTTDVVVPLDEHGYPVGTEDEWLDPMGEAVPTWYIECLMKVTDRHLDGPMEVICADG